MAIVLLAACRAPTARAPAAQACPTVSTEAAPEVRIAATLADADALLPSVIPDKVDTRALLASGPAFVDRIAGYAHGSDTSLHAIGAAWPHGQGAVVMPALVLSAHPLPLAAEPRRREGIAIRALDGGGRHLGLVRIARGGVAEGARIEDHVVDLDTGAHLMMLANVAVSLDAYTVDDTGLGAGDCHWYWND